MTSPSGYQRAMTSFTVLAALAALNSLPAESSPPVSTERVIAVDHDQIGPAAAAAGIRGTFDVNFDRWSSGTYTSDQAAADFGNANGWDAANTVISSGRLRATLEANKIGGDGGTLAGTDVTDGTEYEMTFTVNFHSAFDWSRGGKVGWGFTFGDGASGCNKADGDGASMRLMWYADDSGRTYFRPYLYYATMPSNCGDSFGRSYPTTGSLQRATDYAVSMRVTSNTGSNRNGRAIIRINGTTLLDTPVQWTDNDVKRAVRNIVFHTFRGGSEPHWESDKVGYIYYDNFSIRRIG